MGGQQRPMDRSESHGKGLSRNDGGQSTSDLVMARSRRWGRGGALLGRFGSMGGGALAAAVLALTLTTIGTAEGMMHDSQGITLTRTKSLNPSEMNRLGYGIRHPSKPQTWNSSSFYDPEYVVGGFGLQGDDSATSRRVLISESTGEWPRKAGSWGGAAQGPLAGVVKLLEQHEKIYFLHLQQTRLALRRVETLNRIMQQSGKVFPQEAVDEANRWKNTTSRMDYHLDRFQKYTDQDTRRMQELSTHALPSYLADESTAIEEMEDIQASAAAAAALSGERFLDPPRPALKRVDGQVTHEMLDSKAKRMSFALHSQPSIAQISSKARMRPLLAPEIEEAFRIDTWWDVPIFHPVLLKDGNFEYAEGTELHLVLDIDQTKVVGEGTNDVELVLKCVLWWKEELQHDDFFIPAQVPEDIKVEFREFCKDYDMSEAFRSIMHLLCRPGMKEFVQAHPQAKFWTFTNKDREDQGKIVRDVSDEDGLVGMYQEEPHEVSGRQCIDANKQALAILDVEANRYAGIVNEERPVIGVRGQSKDLSRIAGLVQEKRRKQRQDGETPDDTGLTIVLLDDKTQDAYAQCQANDPSMLCHVTPFVAVTEEQGIGLKAAMERILPVDKLLLFYRAFREAEPAHALVQCIDIMSDDTSTLLKRKGPAGNPRFTYVPKVVPNGTPPLPALPILRPVSKPSPEDQRASVLSVGA